VRWHLWPEVEKDENTYFRIVDIIQISLPHPSQTSNIYYLLHDMAGDMIACDAFDASVWYVNDPNPIRCKHMSEYIFNNYMNAFDGRIIQYEESYITDPETHKIIHLPKLNAEPMGVFNIEGVGQSIDFTLSATKDELIIYNQSEGLCTVVEVYNLNMKLCHTFGTDLTGYKLRLYIHDKNQYTYSQYEHIGFLKSNREVLIYRTDGKLLNRWNFNIGVGISDDRCWGVVNNGKYTEPYHILMLPNNFVAIIEHVDQFMNLYIYKLNGKLYKKIDMREIIHNYDCYLFMHRFLYKKQLTIIYNNIAYILPCV
jgi:hypothetical protein